MNEEFRTIHQRSRTSTQLNPGIVASGLATIRPKPSKQIAR
jgi:hypothetical protein